MHIQGCQLSPIIQGTQDFGLYLPQPRLQGSLLTRPYGARVREALVWFGHMARSRTKLKIKFIFAEPSK